MIFADAVVTASLDACVEEDVNGNKYISADGTLGVRCKYENILAE